MERQGALLNVSVWRERLCMTQLSGLTEQKER